MGSITKIFNILWLSFLTANLIATIKEAEFKTLTDVFLLSIMIFILIINYKVFKENEKDN
nr:MAG TPA: hypothetical protein [Caudoviricetes sp.]